MARYRKPFAVYRQLVVCKSDPNYLKVMMRVWLSNDVKLYFTSKAAVDAQIAKTQFDSKGMPLNPNNYDKKTYRVMRGMYVAVQDATAELLNENDCNPDKIERKALLAKIKENLKVWNGEHQYLPIAQ